MDVDNKDCENEAPLSWAARHGLKGLMKLLLEIGKVDVNSTDHFGQIPLSLASMYGHEVGEKLLLESG